MLCKSDKPSIIIITIINGRHAHGGSSHVLGRLGSGVQILGPLLLIVLPPTMPFPSTASSARWPWTCPRPRRPAKQEVGVHA